MKLLSIRMVNMRRFTHPVEVTGIGPGLNVLAAPNEHGKSTLFDALHALFFFEARSWKQKEAASLAPHAGGNPEVSAEIEVEGQVFRLSKVFSSKSAQRQVSVHRNGHMFKQDEEAENWIRSLIKPPKEGGPAGLLWVRQGLTTLQSDKDETLSARRDLLSSVAGEIEDITGGRKMEATRAALQAALDTYLTKSGATKKHGPLWQAEQDVAELEQSYDELTEKVDQLRAKLSERRALQKEKSQLTDPAAQKDRTDALAAADATLKTAEAFVENQQKAEADIQAASVMRDTHRDRIKTLEAQLTEVHRAQTTMDRLSADLEGAETKLAALDQKLAEAKTAEERARAARQASEQTRDQAVAATARRKDQDQRKQLTQRLAEAEKHAKAVATARAGLAKLPDASCMARLDKAWQEVSLMRSAREASAAAITVTLEPGQDNRVTLDGQPVETDVRRALPEGGVLAVDGVGRVQIHPAAQQDDASYDRVTTAFEAALTATGCSSLNEARAADKQRQSLEATLRDVTAQLKIFAPEGLPALKEAIAALPDAGPDTSDLPSVDDADATFRQARAIHDQAQADLEGVRVAHEAQKGDTREFRVRRDEAQHQFDRATDLIGDPVKAAQNLTTLQTQTPALETALAKAEERARALAAEAPDLAMARAGAERARNVAEHAVRRQSEIEKRLSALEALISHEADLSVEEKLREVEGKRTTAQSHAAQVQSEVNTLLRLDRALADAQAQAHDAYVGPIHKELRPLLRMVLPGAELAMDAESVLPTGLIREDGEDRYDQLSGGTQEQIALLVRLAFARLLAKSGTPAPIILDDAIVYTDDDRIERMFNALTQQAGEMQIIVLSCRQKVFRGLGGNMLDIRPTEPASQT